MIVKPDCYCLGGDRAHYSEAKYLRLQRTYEQARDEAKHLYGECLMLADVLRDAYEVVKTIEGEESDECDKLSDLRMSIEYALAAYDTRRIETANLKYAAGCLGTDGNDPIDLTIAAAEAAPKAVRLTGEEIIGIRQVLAGWDCNTPWSQTIALSRAIESAVLRKNGIKVAE